MSFASGPGPDDSNLPPVNVVIPDDARELDRDVLAYRREMRSRRRRELLSRLLRPLNRSRLGGHVTILPLIALCLALSLVGGALLSVATISPASAPTVSGPRTTSAPRAGAGAPAMLPAGTVQLDGQPVAVRSLVSSVIALVPVGCGCGHALHRLASQATTAHVTLYFIGTGIPSARLATLAARYGDGIALAATDTDGVLDAAYHPADLTVLLVFHDATAEVHRHLQATFQFGPTMRQLALAGG